MSLDLPRIYPITDTRISGLSHLEQVRQLHAGGASLIQLRDKYASSSEFYLAALECMTYAKQWHLRIVINDRVDIALMAGAAGVHLGQDDMPPTAARELLGPAAMIGYSTHSVEQAIAARGMPIDYVAIGPIFATSTKEHAEPVVGLAGISTVTALIGDLPLVGIGGIDRTNVHSVIEAGAMSAACISAVLRGIGPQISDSMHDIRSFASPPTFNKVQK